MRFQDISPKVLLEGKGHLDHPEDLVFLEGGQGVKRAIQGVLNTLKNPNTVTIKWDGYPALIFGRDSQGRFSIMDKHMFNKKDGSGRQVFSPAEFIAYDQERGADRSNLHTVLQRIWPGLEAETRGKGYYWGDLLFFQPLTPVNGKFVFKANPNGIRYEVAVESQIGKLIAGKQAAIAVHQYIAPNAESTDDAVSLDGTIGKLTNSSNVAIVPSAMPNAPKFDPANINKLATITNRDLAKYGSDIDALMTGAPQARNTFNNLFTVYINKKIVSGDMGNLVGDFYKFFETRPMTDAMRAKLTKHLQENQKGVEGAFKLWIDLYNLKNEVVKQLDLNAKNSPVQGFLQDGTPTQEGFVSQGLKFVDRMGFSRQNLAARQNVAEGKEILDEATYRTVLRDLLERFYADMGISPEGGYWFGPLDIKSPGSRVWTRGDGTRYRDPGFIGPGYYGSKEPNKTRVIAQKFWQWLQQQPGVRPLGTISGEFGSSKYSDMVGYKGLYFSGGRNGVEFGSASRFKNPRSVWRRKEATPVEEGWKDVAGATALGAAALAGIAGSAKDHPVTTIQGKEFIQHELPSNTSNVKVVRDDNGQEVYAWVEKSGMRPQYTYYWYAPKKELKEDASNRNVIVVFGGGFQPWSPWHTGSYVNAVKTFQNVPGVKFYIATSNSVKERPIPFAEKEFLIRQAGVKSPIVEVKTPLNPTEILSQYDPNRDVFILVRSEKDPMEFKAKKDGSPGYYQPYNGLDDAQPFGKHGYVYATPVTKHKVGGKVITSASDVRAMYAAADDAQKVSIIKALYPKSSDPVGVKDTFDTYLSGLTESFSIPGLDWSSKQSQYKAEIEKKHRDKDLAKFMDKKLDEADPPNLGNTGVASPLPGTSPDVMYGLPKKVSPREILRKHRSMEKFLGHQFEAASPEEIQSNVNGLGEPGPFTQAATDLRPGPNKALERKKQAHKAEMDKFMDKQLDEADPPTIGSQSAIPGTPKDLMPQPTKAQVRKASAIHKGLEKFFGHKF